MAAKKSGPVTRVRVRLSDAVTHQTIKSWVILIRGATSEQNALVRARMKARQTAAYEPGDRIEAEVTSDWTRVLVVKEIADKPLPKAEVGRLYEDLSPPRPTADPLLRLMRRPPVAREKGAGRPTKKERRLMDDWESSGSD